MLFGLGLNACAVATSADLTWLVNASQDRVSRQLQAEGSAAWSLTEAKHATEFIRSVRKQPQTRVRTD